ncbi:glycosyltransferase family 2 protein [Marmoricola endophyticus]|uniref:glycosyltransferase family 2 protein n=1 Tax=Marmoricola endophyticus TaxID=2040280 RepID=UPI00166D58DB|nr:glycosyltransferase family 2 protein [Marmoricola endophyticus]
MTGATPSGSVLICCYTLHRWDDVLAAVESALEQHPAPLEVIVVVDHNDELLSRLETVRTSSWARQPVRVVPSSHRQGLSGARNTGLALAKGEVLVFLDDDARAQPGWLATHLAAYAEPRVLGVGGRLDPRWDTARPAWFPHDFDWVIGCTHSGVPVGAAPVRNAIGANMSFRTGLLREAGGFSEELGRIGTVPLGCEETEASIRVGRLRPDGDVWYLPDAVVQHRVTAARATWDYFSRRCVAEGRSKATVRALSAEPLATERDYATRVLPRSAARAVWSGLRGDPAGLRRAGAIGAGLGLTAYGFLTGLVRDGASRRRLADLAGQGSR